MYSFTWIAKPVGCFKDTGRRAIPGVDGRYPIIRGYYRKRKDAIRRCALVALRFGYRAFAVQHQGWCATGPRAHLTYRKYGRSSRCRNGKGGPWANDVYAVTGKTEVHITLLSIRNTVKILRNERPKQSQCFSDHKLSMLSQRLFQVNLTGIFWSRELGWTKSRAKTFLYRAGSSNRLLNGEDSHRLVNTVFVCSYALISCYIFFWLFVFWLSYYEEEFPLNLLGKLNVEKSLFEKPQRDAYMRVAWKDWWRLRQITDD